VNLLCEIFRGSRQPEMYLYVDRARGLRDVPAALLARFGQPSTVMTLHLTPDRKLARADAAAVLASIAEKGFYLQMPPGTCEPATPPTNDVD